MATDEFRTDWSQKPRSDAKIRVDAVMAGEFENHEQTGSIASVLIGWQRHDDANIRCRVAQDSKMIRISLKLPPLEFPVSGSSGTLWSHEQGFLPRAEPLVTQEPRE